jgi:hypothetical protein
MKPEPQQEHLFFNQIEPINNVEHMLAYISYSGYQPQYMANPGIEGVVSRIMSEAWACGSQLNLRSRYHGRKTQWNMKHDKAYS